MVGDGTAKPILRDEHGRFVKGSRGGPGNPRAPAARALHEAFAQAVTVDDMREAVRQLMIGVRNGAPWALKEFFERTLGKSVAHVDLLAEVVHDEAAEEIPIPPDYIEFVKWSAAEREKGREHDSG